MVPVDETIIVARKDPTDKPVSEACTRFTSDRIPVGGLQERVEVSLWALRRARRSCEEDDPWDHG